MLIRPNDSESLTVTRLFLEVGHLGQTTLMDGATVMHLSHRLLDSPTWYQPILATSDKDRVGSIQVPPVARVLRQGPSSKFR